MSIKKPSVIFVASSQKLKESGLKKQWQLIASYLLFITVRVEQRASYRQKWMRGRLDEKSGVVLK